MKRILVLVAVLALALSPAALAKGGFGGGGFSGGSKGGGGFSSGGSKSSYGGGGSKSFSSSKPPTASKPSSGPISQPRPMTRLIPKVAPPTRISTVKIGGRPSLAKVTLPRGRNYSRDYRTVTGGSYMYRGSRYYYGDPYGPSYFGTYDSPYYYMWLSSVMNNNSANYPQPPQAQGNQVSDALESYLGVIQQEAQFMADKGAKK